MAEERDGYRKKKVDDESGAVEAVAPMIEEIKDKKPTDSFVKKKIKAINESALPDWQKKEYIKILLGDDPERINVIAFNVWAKLRGIDITLKAAMEASPKANQTATVSEWDAIFSDF